MSFAENPKPAGRPRSSVLGAAIGNPFSQKMATLYYEALYMLSLLSDCLFMWL
jgi:hypothetical protein